VTARTAGLRVAHQRSCAHANKTSLESVRGCTCENGKRAYYVLWRDRSGVTRKSPRVRDRREAEKLLRAKQVEIDQGRTGAEALNEVGSLGCLYAVQGQGCGGYPSPAAPARGTHRRGGGFPRRSSR
jgi:hypothetical protein